MAQERIAKDGTVLVANTVYLPKDKDEKAQKKAKAKLRSKSSILVEILVNAL